jgi:uncharacterized protein
MHLLILVLVLLALIVGPAMWVKAVMKRYSFPPDRYPKTGGEVARELLDELGLGHVRTESTQQGDHYDPLEKAVRLSPENFDGRSLTAVTVAAHEVGHAVQDALDFGPLRWRTRLVSTPSPRSVRMISSPKGSEPTRLTSAVLRPSRVRPTTRFASAPPIDFVSVRTADK